MRGILPVYCGEKELRILGLDLVIHIGTAVLAWNSFDMALILV